MSLRPTALTGIVLGSLFLSGCGTACNVGTVYSERPRVFGGVPEDLTALFQGDNWLVCHVAIVDLPLSIVGDLFTLPWVVKASRDAKPVGPVPLPVR
ncbi:MAG: hypothetical protein JWO38_2025 [Gemmataceae bacterium]|nr:hypothetical protein [Gemmataceae bacterium]